MEKRLNIKMEEAEYWSWKESAKHLGYNLTDMVKEAVREYLKQEIKNAELKTAIRIKELEVQLKGQKDLLKIQKTK